jgi:vitamin B12 transporter
MGNPNLKPEKSHGFDVGFDQYFLDHHVTLSATYFRNNLRDLINFVPTSFVTGYYVNEDTAQSQGVELSALLTLCKNWKTEAAYTYTDTSQTSGGVTQERDLIPKNDLSLDTSYLFFDKLQVGCGVSFIGGRVDTDYSLIPSAQVKLSDYWTARIYSRYTFNERFSIYGRIENVTNSYYQDALGYPGLPIGVYAGAEIKF